MPALSPRAVAALLGAGLALAGLACLGPARARVSNGDAALSRLEVRLHDAINRARAEHHLIPLRRLAVLDRAARAHSADMATRRFLSHANPTGENPVDRLLRAGADGFSLAGENVGMTTRADPNREILDGWLVSPPHRRNLLAAAFNATGIGIAAAADGTLYYTQVYATFPR